METKKVEIGKSFSYGWAEIKKNFWYFVGMAVIVMVIKILSGGFGNEKTSLSIVGFLVNVWIGCGSVKLLLDYYDGNKRELSEMFTQFKYFWRALGANILILAIFIVGLVLFIIPGIYFALRFMFTVTLIIDKNLDISEAMKKSTAMTLGIKWQLFGFALVAFGVIILGAICLGVGMLVAIPVVWLAYVNLYRNLLNGNSFEKSSAE